MSQAGFCIKAKEKWVYSISLSTLTESLIQQKAVSLMERGYARYESVIGLGTHTPITSPLGEIVTLFDDFAYLDVYIFPCT